MFMIEVSDEYQFNYLEALRQELIEIVSKDLSPMARKLGYTEEPLEQKIKWRPCVLVLGNYSSGKSTFINELVGVNVQLTGQAPTDDSFTVISYEDGVDGVEERDGKALLGGVDFPFGGLRKFGQRFSSHFRLKKCSSTILKGFAIIDTPGMLDSISEKDRGYDYQDVIAELAEIADLVLVMFDPHKAGTIRETYDSLRKTLPRATYEDRVIFVLNRVDECSHLQDLLRVYGTLCWNLSQMTGRKDIPHIRLTWSEETAKGEQQNFLELLENQRNELKTEIENAPRRRLDHLVTFIEEHGRRLKLFGEVLLSFHKKKRSMALKTLLATIVSSLAMTSLTVYGLLILDGVMDAPLILAATLVSGISIGIIIFYIVNSVVLRSIYRRSMSDIDKLVNIKTDLDRDTWESIKPKVRNFLIDSKGNFHSKELRTFVRSIDKLQHSKTRELRKALEDVPKSEYPK